MHETSGETTMVRTWFGRLMLLALLAMMVFALNMPIASAQAMGDDDMDDVGVVSDDDGMDNDDFGFDDDDFGFGGLGFGFGDDFPFGGFDDDGIDDDGMDDDGADDDGMDD